MSPVLGRWHAHQRKVYTRDELHNQVAQRNGYRRAMKKNKIKKNKNTYRKWKAGRE